MCLTVGIMNNQPEMTDATREAIVMAFCSAAREKPIERVTVKEIARLAGYNRTTFYRYFADCSMVLEYMERERQPPFEDFADAPDRKVLRGDMVMFHG